MLLIRLSRFLIFSLPAYNNNIILLDNKQPRVILIFDYTLVVSNWKIEIIDLKNFKNILNQNIFLKLKFGKKSWNVNLIVSKSLKLSILMKLMMK